MDGPVEFASAGYPRRGCRRRCRSRSWRLRGETSRRRWLRSERGFRSRRESIRRWSGVSPRERDRAGHVAVGADLRTGVGFAPRDARGVAGIDDPEVRVVRGGVDVAPAARRITAWRACLVSARFGRDVRASGSPPALHQAGNMRSGGSDGLVAPMSSIARYAARRICASRSSARPSRSGMGR